MAKRKGMTGFMAAVPMSFEPTAEPPAYGAFPTRQNQGKGDQEKIDFVGLIAKGESSRGFIAQTANGTSRDQGTGWNRDEPWSSSQLEPRGPWKSGPSNRTGE
jgi:hypothetical protein